jgi:molybdenum cofactor cytidylyltransferase
MRVGAIVLAAGESARMGQPKQLLALQGITMLQRAISTASRVATPLVVVLGHEADRIMSEVLPAKTPDRMAVVNEEWREGIASSIRCGLETLLELDAATEGVLIVLADQPLIRESDLEQLVRKFSEGSKPIVASAFSGTVGPPAVFARAIFAELLALRGDHGAKRIMSADPSRVISVPLPRAAVDVDTPEQYQKVLPEVESGSPPRRSE